MPLTDFVCPDGQTIETKECLEHCRLPRRCLTRTTLEMVAKDREWDGVPHVTSLLNGTMMEVLKINFPYAVVPESRAFTLLGSSHHALLEERSWGIAEIGFNDGEIQGTADLVEVEDGERVLTDYKTWGSNRVARALGMRKDSGVWSINPAEADLRNELLQVNRYRIALEKQFGCVIDRQQLQVTVRDGGIAAARSRGITKSIYLIPIAKLTDSTVLEFFRGKAERLKLALRGELDQNLALCSEEERWDDKRCTDYCEVRKYCWYGRSL